MKWEVNENGRVALKEVANRTARVMESVKLACRQAGIEVHHDRFRNHKGAVNAIQVGRLGALLERLNDMSRHTQKPRKSPARRRRTRREPPDIHAARKGLAPFPAKDLEKEYQAEFDVGAAAMPDEPSEVVAKRMAVEYRNGTAPSNDWDAFVKALQEATRLAKGVDVVSFGWVASDGKVSFERNVVDSISVP